MRDYSTEKQLFRKFLSENGFEYTDNALPDSHIGDYRTFWTKQFPVGLTCYRKRPATYYGIESKHDDYGYRLHTSSENLINETDSVFCFGCSITYGMGVESDVTWPALLEKKIRIKAKNYGVPAASYDGIARRLFQILNAIPKESYPKHVFILFPNVQRTEYIFSEKNVVTAFDFVGKQFNIDAGDTIERIFKDRPFKSMMHCYNYTTYMTAFYNAIKNFRFIETLLKEKNISWSWTTWSDIFGIIPPCIVDNLLNKNTELCDGMINVIECDTNGADGRHPGPVYMDNVSDQFVRMYNNQSTLIP